MSVDKNDRKIKIVKDGPYLVSGSMPLTEKIITSGHESYEYKEGRTFPREEFYALCRCGSSKEMPYCDGTHSKVGFDGSETASREPYIKRAELIEGPGLDLTDDESLCAVARFCHREEGSAWEFIEKSDDPKLKEQAIKAACECPAGRLVVWDKASGEAIEPFYEPSIVIIQDPEKDVSGPIWVRGGIPIESSDGTVYELRNRVTLCRCGESKNKPFCEASHITAKFSDKG